MKHVALRLILIGAFTLCRSLSFAASPLAQLAEGPALRVEIVEGDGAVNNIRSRVAREPAVRVVDRNNKPVAGAAVSFLLPQTGASGSFAGGTSMLNVITNAQGLATATGFQANGAAGAFQINVVASFQGQTATAAIAQSNAALGAATGAGGASGSGSAGAGAGAGTGATTGISVGVIAAVGAAVAGAVVAGVVMNSGKDPKPFPPITPDPPVVSPIGFTIGNPSVNPRK